MGLRGRVWAAPFPALCTVSGSKQDTAPEPARRLPVYLAARFRNNRLGKTGTNGKARGSVKTSRRGLLACVLAVGLSAQQRPASAQEVTIDGVSFADRPGVLFVPIRDAAEALGWSVRWDAQEERAYLEGKPVPDTESRQLPDSSTLLPIRALEGWGAEVRWHADRNAARLRYQDREAWVRYGEKRVAINRATQRMRAWQGDRLVLDTRVSTGRRGHGTPTGRFTAGPYRARMHYSSLYDNAPMPWSIQVSGNIFIHGFHSVPPRAASHGCIRVPLYGGNPARWLYRWMDNGTPIVIADGWA